ncbi:hypothetical protein [Amycolatopsis panacis]|uniref:DUF320 domain-containing protein n=1 Tax=Amycolatopsis panacis TaxID=2340917 RepID=A0A419I8H9_9PSEU|nr:hypothetical protein [Amycolatopsis panacis]RJQ88476.1 hypothetical protein D5S19_06975 [Amycolatopsis panacis]
MLKKIGLVTATMAAGAFMFGGVAAAGTSGTAHHGGHGGHHHGSDQNGLVNVNNLDVAHNVNLTLGLCDNNINAVGVQVPLRDVLEGVGLPILSPGKNTATGSNPTNCASGNLLDGGTSQHN